MPVMQAETIRVTRQEQQAWQAGVAHLWPNSICAEVSSSRWFAAEGCCPPTCSTCDGVQHGEGPQSPALRMQHRIIGVRSAESTSGR